MVRLFVCVTLFACPGVAAFAQVAGQPPTFSGRFDQGGQRIERAANNPEQPKTAFKTIPEWAKLAATAGNESGREATAQAIERIAVANRPEADKLSDSEISDCRKAAMELVKSKEVGPRISGLVALQKVGDADAKKVALSAAKHSNPDVKEAGLKLLTHYCDDSTIPMLTAYAIARGSLPALNAIAEQKSPAAKKALEEIAEKSKKPALREAATAALSKRGDK